MMITSALIYISYLSTLQALQINFPVKVSGSWELHDLDKSDCSSFVKSQGIGFIEGKFILPGSAIAVPVDGHWCSYIRKSKECHRSLLFQDYIQETVEELDPDLLQCKSMLNKQLMGHYLDNSSPDPICSWLSTVSVNHTFISMIPHIVTYSPYQGIFYSNKFKYPDCHSPPCISRDGKRYWIPNSNQVQECKKRDDEDIIPIWVGKEHNTMVFKSALGTYEHSQICKMTFCDRPGIRLNNTLWLGYLPPMLNYHESFKQFEDCKREILVVDKKTEMRNHYILNVLQEIAYSRCLGIVASFQKSRTITDQELRMIVPDHLGWGPVFDIKGGKLYSNIGYYQSISVNITSDNPHFYSGTRELTDIPLKCGDNSCRSWNGLEIKGGVVYYTLDINQQSIAYDLEDKMSLSSIKAIEDLSITDSKTPMTFHYNHLWVAVTVGVGIIALISYIIYQIYKSHISVDFPGAKQIP